jgi:Polyketide cyclase / dehydrase and lipid transport
MATVRKEITIEQSQEVVWDAIRDVGEIHKRLVPGFVVNCVLEDGSRIVTFENGMVLRELIVDVDDQTRRHAWATHDEPFIHYNASAQVFSNGPNKCRVVWIADLLPNNLANKVAPMMQRGLEVMKQTLERVERGESRSIRVPGGPTRESGDKGAQ